MIVRNFFSPNHVNILVSLCVIPFIGVVSTFVRLSTHNKKKTLIYIYGQRFKEMQKLLSKTNGEVVADLMTPAPLVVREATNLESAARCVFLT